MTKSRIKIYTSRWHLAFTFFIIVAPFLFFLIFSRVTHIAATFLFSNVLVSFVRVAVAYLVAAFLGWIFAVSFYRGKRAMIALPIFDVLQSFPTFAALPLAVTFWGASNFTVIFFLVITILWPVFFSIISSLKLIKRDWEEAADIAGLRGYNYLVNFLVPVSIPGLITGSIVGLGEGWEALVATEIIVGLRLGLGEFFRLNSYNFSLTAFGILGFLILIFSINKLVWIPLLDLSHKKMEE